MSTCHASSIASMYADRQWLDTSPGLTVHLIRQREAQMRRMWKVSTQRSVVRGSCMEFHGQTQIVSSSLAVIALRTSLSRFHGHSLSYAQMPYCGADFTNHRTSLVAQYHRFLKHKITDSTVLPVVDVWPANPDTVRFKQHFCSRKQRSNWTKKGDLKMK